MSCKKLLEIDPPITSSSAENVYSSNATAAAVLTGVYADMSSTGMTLDPSDILLTVAAGLSADELIVFNQNDITLMAYYNNSLLPVNSSWSRIYNFIFVANSAIEGLYESTTLTPEVKKQLIGEAKFIRAFSYFYLTNLYGDVPLAVTTNYKVNAVLPRTPQKIVYEQIISDLKEAKEMLSNNYVSPGTLSITEERVRPTKWAAAALLARVYLYNRDYLKAESEATNVISNVELYNITDVALKDVFLKNSREAIWQLQPTGGGAQTNSKEGQVFVPLEGQPFSVPVYLNTYLVSSFEAGDQRKDGWVNSIAVGGETYYYNYKYKIGLVDRSEPTEYSMVLRLAEQYLIRAEARARQGNISGAATDLDVIRRRAGLEGTTATTQAAMLAAVEHERQVELFAEWGHRWLDLKRTNRADDVLSPIKQSNWQLTDQLYPIPQVDINRNPALVGHQNPGYP